MMTNWRSRNSQFWKGVLIYFGVSILFWGRFVLLQQSLFYDTLFKYYFPDAVFFRKSILAWKWPFWNPHMYSGIPFLANAETSVFYPFTLLQILFSYPNAALITTGLHAFMAAVFMYFLIREFGLSYQGAILGGLVYAFNGYYVDHYAYPHIYQGYAWLPFTVWAFHKSLIRKYLYPTFRTSQTTDFRIYW